MKKTGIAVTIAAVLVVILTAGGMYVSQESPNCPPTCPVIRDSSQIPGPNSAGSGTASPCAR